MLGQDAVNASMGMVELKADALVWDGKGVTEGTTEVTSEQHDGSVNPLVAGGYWLQISPPASPCCLPHPSDSPGEKTGTWSTKGRSQNLRLI